MRCGIIFLALTNMVLSASIEEEAIQEFVNGNHRFSSAIYKELVKNKKGNVIVSPLSAETVLALANEGARGETAIQLTTGLSLPSTIEKIQKAFKHFLPKLKKSDDELKLLSANKIYVGQDVKLEQEFRSVATDIYDSGVENVDFTQNTQAAQIINSWVEDQTNSKIKDLIKPDVLDEDTTLVLVNALYFSGKWVSPFKDYNTQPKKFYRTKEDTVELDTMHQTSTFNYYENPDLSAKFLELPYKGADIRMVIVLPNEIEGLSSLERNIDQLLLPQPFASERVDVQLPKFMIETEIDFVPILTRLGIEKLFEDSADLSGISSTHKKLHVSKVIQKAFINVTESGTEAAAATTVVAKGTSSLQFITPPKIYHFHVDRPFLYYIKVGIAPSGRDMAEKSGLTVCLGRVMGV